MGPAAGRRLEAPAARRERNRGGRAARGAHHSRDRHARERGGLVHQYVDFVLAKAEAEQPRSFREGLAWLDRRSQALFGSPFAALDAARQDELLGASRRARSSEEPAGVDFFATAKQLTVDGYYRSEAAMTEELGFEGRTFLAEFKGCTHPEHRNWEVED